MFQLRSNWDLILLGRLVGLAEMAAIVTLTATLFLGMMIDSLNGSDECWDLKECEGMGDYLVSSDDRMNQWYLADFCGNGRLACAWVSTDCRKVLRVVVNGG